MKKLILWSALFAGSMLLNYPATAQADLSDGDSYDVTVRLLNKKGKTFKGIGTIVYIKGTDDMNVAPPNGIVVVPNANPDDTLCILSSAAIFELPVLGMDSINVVFHSNRKLQGYYSQNKAEMFDHEYFTVNRKANTGSTRSIDVSDAASFSKLLNFLEGRLPGVDVNPQTGIVQIRGINSINSSTQPLVVVDGVPMSVESANATVIPREIESITVDKQGSIYGMRGSNGVIIIKRKTGGE